jgi:hypothetical protein
MHRSKQHFYSITPSAAAKSIWHGQAERVRSLEPAFAG